MSCHGRLVHNDACAVPPSKRNEVGPHPTDALTQAPEGVAAEDGGGRFGIYVAAATATRTTLSAKPESVSEALQRHLLPEFVTGSRCAWANWRGLPRETIPAKHRSQSRPSASTRPGLRCCTDSVSVQRERHDLRFPGLELRNEVPC